MSRSIERAEIGPQILPHHHTPQERGKYIKLTAAMAWDGISQWLPHGSPAGLLGRAALMGGTFGALDLIHRSFTNTPATVEAAGCKVELAVLGFQYINNPNTPGARGIIGYHDFVFPPVRFGDAVVYWQRDPSDPKSPKQEIARGTMKPKEDHEEIVFKLNQDANIKGADQSPALRVEVGFAEDPIKQAGTNLPVTKPVTIRCGKFGWFRGGRYATSETIDAMAQGSKFAIRKVGTVVDEVTKRVFGTAAGIAPKVDNPQENLKDIKDNRDRLKKDSDEVKRAEVAKALQITVASTRTVTSTAVASSVYTGELRAAIKQDFADQIDKTARDLEGRLQGANGTLDNLNSEQKANSTKLSQGIEALESIKNKVDRGLEELAAIKGRLPVVPSGSAPGTKPEPTPTTENGGPLDVALGAAGFVLDLPAKAADRFTEPDTKQPIRRAGINVVAWVLALGAGLFAKKKFF